MLITYSSLRDEQLIKLLKADDTAAFSELYMRYNKAVFAYVLRFVKVQELAEDLVHEIFLRIWEVRDRLEIQTSFAAYLYKSCHNKAVNTLKKAAADREFRKQLLTQLSKPVATTAVSADTFRRYDELVEKALAELPAQRRKVFVMVRQEGKTYREVADELGVSVNTIKDHLQKATQTLKTFINQTGELVLITILLEKIF